MAKAASKRKERIQLLNYLSRDISTRTIFFHQWIANYLGLSEIDHKCLDIVLRSEKPLTGNQLAYETSLTAGAITGIVDRLEKAGYVYRQRDKQDRRLVYVIPFREKALMEIGPLFEILQKGMDKIFSDYDDKELDLITDYLSKTVKVLEDATIHVRSMVESKRFKQKT
ncbi:MarR family winged helix-turn-helix transcriptional regulator [Candidatus Nitrosocosmicus franklandus]|uniref:MarR family protein n=1 Tax=Candidatus Nitrosocosmicus franklandianus TaxID=1798806 RepID=A0A484I8F0_9ARCH|nr:MarR family transcriptional regulator [Candidatus Nitrosocosmicus franklandus]VFJ13481.1 MarR family protein [Candidatus Nitrosocosmicus franklandus]